MLVGVWVTQEEFVDAALETKADAILISFLSGHAEVLAEGFREKCGEAELDDIVLPAGGYFTLRIETVGREMERKYIPCEP